MEDFYAAVGEGAIFIGILGIFFVLIWVMLDSEFDPISATQGSIALTTVFGFILGAWWFFM